MQPDFSKLKEVEKYLSQYSIDYHFYFEDLRDGSIIQYGEEKRYPFASCFKLAVLGTLVEKLTTEEQWKKTVQILDRDIPKLAMGVVNYLDAPVELNISNLTRLMMAFSDGTSTDLLIREVGIESVQKFLEGCTKDSQILNDVRGLLDVLLAESIKIAKDPKNINRREYLLALEQSTMKQDFSNAKDASMILKKLLEMGPIARQFLFRDQGVQRLGMYSLDEVRLYGKTGTLGYWVSANDSVVVVVNGEPRAVVSLFTLGWKEPRYMIEHAFGEVGLMVSNLYRAKPVYSPAYGFE